MNNLTAYIINRKRNIVLFFFSNLFLKIFLYYFLFMKNFLLFSLLIFIFLNEANSQSATKATLAAIENGYIGGKKNDGVSCDVLNKYISNYGVKLSSSYGGYKSNSIDRIDWYRADGRLFARVYFKYLNSSSKKVGKGYIYGGWEDNSKNYDLLKSSFEQANSKGDFFWKYINPSTIDCY